MTVLLKVIVSASLRVGSSDSNIYGFSKILERTVGQISKPINDENDSSRGLVF